MYKSLHRKLKIEYDIYKTIWITCYQCLKGYMSTVSSSYNFVTVHSVSVLSGA